MFVEGGSRSETDEVPIIHLMTFSYGEGGPPEAVGGIIIMHPTSAPLFTQQKEGGPPTQSVVGGQKSPFFHP